MLVECLVTWQPTLVKTRYCSDFILLLCDHKGCPMYFFYPCVYRIFLIDGSMFASVKTHILCAVYNVIVALVISICVNLRVMTITTYMLQLWAITINFLFTLLFTSDPELRERLLKEQEKRAHGIIQGMSAGLYKGLLR